MKEILLIVGINSESYSSHVVTRAWVQMDSLTNWDYINSFFAAVGLLDYCSSLFSIIALRDATQFQIVPNCLAVVLMTC